ncbi:MAG: hypothetical protein ABL967_00050 [Bryobacteraceae bacterium]
MRFDRFRASLLMLVLGFLGLAGVGRAATFGSVVPVRGTVSDIALDESRHAVYAANFTAYRIEVIDISLRTIRTTISVSRPPSAIALSPNSRYLVIGEYETPNPDPAGVPPFDGHGGVTIRDLNTNFVQHYDLATPVLTVAFGADGQAIVVTRAEVLRLDPGTGIFTSLGLPALASRDLPVELARVPSQIIQATSGTSLDRKKIFVLAGVEDDLSASSSNAGLLIYDVDTLQLRAEIYDTSPPQGPRSLAADATGANLMLGWGLLHRRDDKSYLWAQFQGAKGDFHLGSHAWSTVQNKLYSQVPADGDGAVLHIVDTDNLTVQERIQLPQNLSGKSVLSNDQGTMFSASEGGIVILPLNQLPSTPRVAAQQEDLLFAADACNRLVLTQTLDITTLGNVPTDFTLSLPAGVTGISFSATSGVAPAQVRITIDPSVFQSTKGTTAIPLTITSSTGVNLPAPVRLLINTRDFDQRGTIVNIPGKLVDMLADPGRGRLYILRQDRNQVQVWDTATLSLQGILRTSNTPTQMAMTVDNRYLIVGADNSQIATVHDLDTLQATDPILFPLGHYPRSIAAAATEMFALARNAGVELVCDADGAGSAPTALIDQIDFENRVAFSPCTLGGRLPSAYQNDLPTEDGVLTASADRKVVLLALADGNVAEYDSEAGTWVASRADTDALAGPYAAIENNLFLAGANLMDQSLMIGSTFQDAAGTTPSGHGTFGGWGVRTLATTPNAAGTIQRWNTANKTVVSSTPMAEAPITAAFLASTPVGQIGQTLLSFTRSIAVSPDQHTLYAATISGLTVFPADFDATPQPPVVTSISNPADSTANVATGGAITIRGVGLAGTTIAAGFPLPSTLGESCITVNNIALPLFRVSPTESVAQLPFTVSGAAALVVRSPGGISSPFPITVATTAPAIFHTAETPEGSGLPAIYRDDNGAPVMFSNPIHPNTEFSIYMTGLGATSPAAPLGDRTPAGVAYNAIQVPAITLGSQSIPVTSAALLPGESSVVYQIKAKVPGQVQPGKTVPLTIQGGGVTTTLTVRVVTP